MTFLLCHTERSINLCGFNYDLRREGALCVNRPEKEGGKPDKKRRNKSWLIKSKSPRDRSTDQPAAAAPCVAVIVSVSVFLLCFWYAERVLTAETCKMKCIPLRGSLDKERGMVVLRLSIKATLVEHCGPRVSDVVSCLVFQCALLACVHFLMVSRFSCSFFCTAKVIALLLVYVCVCQCSSKNIAFLNEVNVCRTAVQNVECVFFGSFFGMLTLHQTSAFWSGWFVE